MSKRTGKWQVERNPDANQKWHARYISANGRIIASTEPYTRMKGALNAIKVLRAASWDAPVFVKDADGNWRMVT